MSRAPRLRSAARHASRTRDEQWCAIEALGHEVDCDLQAARRPPDDGRRADVRLDRRHRRRRMEHRRRWARPKRQLAARLSSGCAAAMAPAACCTTARASGIRANRCRAGRWAATGGATACRSGTIRRLIADESRRLRRTRRARRARSSRRWPSGSASIRSTYSPATRTSGTTCGGAAAADQRRSARNRKLRRSGGARAAAPGLRARPRARWSATRCRSRAGERRRAAGWASGPGSCATSTCTYPRRLADGLSPAARFAAVGARRRLPGLSARRRDPLAPRRIAGSCAAAGRHASLPSARRRRVAGVRRRVGTHADAARAAAAGASASPPAGRPHRALRRGRGRPRSTSSCRRVARLEDYLDLVAAVEDDRARRCSCRCCSKATAAARSAPRRSCSVTPDPGVIEVNIQPARELGRARASTPRRSTRRRARRG